MVDLITTDVEKIYQLLKTYDFPPKVIEFFIEQHETQRQLQNAVNAYAEQMSKMIAALSLLHQGFGMYKDRLQAIEGKFSDPYKDMVKAAEDENN